MKNGLPSVSSLSARTNAGFASCWAIASSSFNPTDVEPLQHDALVRRLTTERAQRVRERMLAVELDVAVETEGEHPLPRHRPRNVPEHGDRVAVGPVEVVEDEQDRGTLGRRDQELRDGIEQTEALLVGLQRDRLRDGGEPPPQPPHPPGGRRGGGARGLAQRFGADGAGVRLDRLDERPVRRRPLALIAAAREDTRPVALRQLCPLLRQARLPDPGLADDHDERSVARLYPVEE